VLFFLPIFFGPDSPSWLGVLAAFRTDSESASVDPKHPGIAWAKNLRKEGIHTQKIPTFSSTTDQVPLASVSYVGFVVFAYWVRD
jgi:hypothetical protein